LCHVCSAFVTVLLYIGMHTVGEHQVIHYFTSSFLQECQKIRLESLFPEKNVCFGGVRPRSFSEAIGKRGSISSSVWNWILFRFSAISHTSSSLQHGSLEPPWKH